MCHMSTYFSPESPTTAHHRLCSHSLLHTHSAWGGLQMKIWKLGLGGGGHKWRGFQQGGLCMTGSSMDRMLEVPMTHTDQILENATAPRKLPLISMNNNALGGTHWERGKHHRHTLYHFSAIYCAIARAEACSGKRVLKTQREDASTCGQAGWGLSDNEGDRSRGKKKRLSNAIISSNASSGPQLRANALV